MTILLFMICARPLSYFVYIIFGEDGYEILAVGTV
jgi:hypothetical protein